MRVAVRIVQFPLTRIILALLAVAAASIAVQAGVNALRGGLSDAAGMWLSVVSGIVTVHFAYVLYARVVERRPVRELAIEGAATELGAGALIGAGLLAVCVGVLWVVGFYTDEAVRSPAVTVGVLAASIQAGYVEEVFFCGIIFRITEQGFGSAAHRHPPGPRRAAVLAPPGCSASTSRLQILTRPNVSMSSYSVSRAAGKPVRVSVSAAARFSGIHAAQRSRFTRTSR